MSGRLPNIGHKGKGRGAIFSFMWQKQFLKMKSKMTKVAIAISTTINPWVGVTNLAHIQTIFSMVTKVFAFSNVLKNYKLYTRKMETFCSVQVKTIYLCSVFASQVVWRTTKFTQWKWKSGLLDGRL